MPRGNPIGSDEREGIAERIAARYQAGATIRELAGELELSYGAVHGMLAGRGVLRSRGRRKGKRYPSNEDRSTPGMPEATGRPDPDFDVDAELREHFFGPQQPQGGSDDRPAE